MKRLKIGFVLLIILVSLLLFPTVFAESEDEDMPYVASQREYDLSYDDIISLYRLEFLSLNEDRDHVPHRLFNDLIWVDEYSCDLTAIKAEVGYALKDINGDGIDELLIGRSPAYINEVFTIRNGKTKELIRAGYRYDCFLLNDDTLYRTGSNGAAFYSSELYRMDDAGAIVFVKGYSQDGEYAYEHGMGDDEEAWFSMPYAQTIYGNEMPDRLVATREARAWIEDCESRFADVPFILLFGENRDEFTGVIIVKGKQTGNDKVRVRRTPDRKGKILASLKVGTELTVTGEENGYYRVKLPEGEGYILKEFLMPRDAAPEGQPGRPAKSNGKGTDAPKPTETTRLELTPALEAGSGTETGKPEKEPVYETVIDHYEKVEVQRSRQVIDHYETYYPKQSIYRFRGADVGSYLSVKQLFVPPVGEVLSLQRNFRSCNALRRWFNDTFSVLLPEETAYQSKFESIPMEDESEEDDVFSGAWSYSTSKKTNAGDVAAIIRKLVHDSKILIQTPKERKKGIAPHRIRYRDIMVITRTTTPLKDILPAMKEFGIPCRVDGRTVFSDCPAFVAMADLSAVFANPSDSLAVYRVLRGDLFAFSREEITAWVLQGKRLRLYGHEEDAEDDISAALTRLNDFRKKNIMLLPSALCQAMLDEFQLFLRCGTESMEYVWFAIELLRNGTDNLGSKSLTDAASYLSDLARGKTDTGRVLNLNEESDRVYFPVSGKYEGEGTVYVTCRGGAAAGHGSAGPGRGFYLCMILF